MPSSIDQNKAVRLSCVPSSMASRPCRATGSKERATAAEARQAKRSPGRTRHWTRPVRGTTTGAGQWAGTVSDAQSPQAAAASQPRNAGRYGADQDVEAWGFVDIRLAPEVRQQHLSFPSAWLSPQATRATVPSSQSCRGRASSPIRARAQAMASEHRQARCHRPREGRGQSPSDCTGRGGRGGYEIRKGFRDSRLLVSSAKTGNVFSGIRLLPQSGAAQHS